MALEEVIIRPAGVCRAMRSSGISAKDCGKHRQAAEAVAEAVARGKRRAGRAQWIKVLRATRSRVARLCD